MDERWMREALLQAREALWAGETPVGCVIVRGGEIVARARNRREELGLSLIHIFTATAPSTSFAARSAAASAAPEEMPTSTPSRRAILRAMA